MPQKTIDSWIFNVDFRKYFYLKWTASQFRPDFEATWLDRKPANVNVCHSIKLKGLNHEIVLCGELTNKYEYTLATETEYDSVPIIKSHLQKCVRQMQTNKAVKTALHFIRMDLNGFLRRLPIIMVEDTRLIAAFTTVVWLMCADSCGYVLSHNHIQWLIGVVHTISENPLYEADLCAEVGAAMASNTKPFSIVENLKEINDKNDIIQSLVYTLQLRKGYGGLKADQFLLDIITRKWLNASKERYDTLFRLVRPIRVDNSSAPLTKKEFLLSAIDFHTHPNMVAWICDKHDEYEPDQIKSAIWNQSSSHNSRFQNSDTNIDVWDVIKKDVRGIQYYLLMR